jgi:hypothetical protein
MTALSKALKIMRGRTELRHFIAADRLLDPLLDVVQALEAVGIDHEDTCQKQLGRGCSCKYRELDKAVAHVEKEIR